MNTRLGDAALHSIWETDTVTVDTDNYGADLDLGAAGRFLTGRVEVEFYVTTAFTGASTVALTICSDSTAAPTTVIRTLFDGLKTALTVGTSHKIVLNTHELSQYVRMNVDNAGTASTGALRAKLNPIKS